MSVDPMDGVGTRIKRPQRAPSPEHSEKMAIYESGSRPSPDTKSASTLIWDFPASRIVRSKFLFFIYNPDYSTLLYPKRLRHSSSNLFPSPHTYIPQSVLNRAVRSCQPSSMQSFLVASSSLRGEAGALTVALKAHAL